MILQRVTPLYPAQSRIYVDRALPSIMSNEMQLGQSANYVYTQAELIRSTPVLVSVAEAEANANLETFREVDNRVGFLKENLSVTVGTKDDIINVWLQLPNGQDAAHIVNSVVDAYISRYAENRRTSTVEVLNILRNEKQLRDAELEQRRQALVDFRKQHTALAIQVDKENVITRRFSALSEELNQTEIALLEAKARYNRAKQMYDKPSDRIYLLESASKHQAGMRDMDLEQQVRQIEQVLTSERAQWGEGHPRVRLLRDSFTKQQRRLKEQQQAIIVAYVDDLRQEFEVLEHKRKELSTAYERQFKLATDVSSQALELAALEEAFDRTERLCDILDERIKEVDLSQGVGAIDVSILEPAAASTQRSYPVPSRFLASGVLAGGLLGFGLAWLRDLLDHRLKSVDEIASVLQLPVLGCFPISAISRKIPKSGGWLRFHRVPSPRSRCARCERPCTSDSQATIQRSLWLLRRPRETANRPLPATWRSPWPRPISVCSLSTQTCASQLSTLFSKPRQPAAWDRCSPIGDRLKKPSFPTFWSRSIYCRAARCLLTLSSS